MDFAKGVTLLEEVIQQHPEDPVAYERLAYEYHSKEHVRRALEVTSRGMEAAGHTVTLVGLNAKSLAALGREPEAEAILRQSIEQHPEVPEFRLALADHFAQLNDLESERAALEDADDSIPDNEEILSRYALTLQKFADKKLALVPYRQLLRLKPSDPSYLTRRGNVYLDLELNDLAMADYKEASKLECDESAWILANIGNLLKNRGFYREGGTYLKRALEIAPDDNYAHERLAHAIKFREEEEKKATEIAKEAKRAIALAKAARASAKAEEKPIPASPKLPHDESVAPAAVPEG